MGCGVYKQQLRQLDDALGALRLGGISELSQPFRILSSKRAELLSKVGFKFPRTPLSLLRLIGLSPGIIMLFFDPEDGWLSMARAKQGAPPVYKLIPAETALAILKGELTHELEEELLTPEEVFVA